MNQKRKNENDSNDTSNDNDDDNNMNPNNNNINSSNIGSSSIIIMSSKLCETMSSSLSSSSSSSSKLTRLAPVYIGIQQIRPNTITTTTNTANITNTTTAKTNTYGSCTTNDFHPIIDSDNKIDTTNGTTNSIITYKVYNHDGTERRMTAQEKKQAKIQYKLLQKQTKLKEQKEQQQSTATISTKGNNHNTNNDRDSMIYSMNLNNNDNNNMNVYNNNDKNTITNDPTVHQLNVSIDGSDNDNNNNNDDDICYNIDKPPVMLSSSMAQIFLQNYNNIMKEQQQQQSSLLSIQLTNISIMDMKLSQLWAKYIYQSIIQPTEMIRQNETNIRMMPYQIIPQVWTRLKPTFIDNHNNSNNNNKNNNEHSNKNNTMVDTNNDDFDISHKNNNHQDWLWCNPPKSIVSDNMYNRNHHNIDHTMILQLLHHHTNMIHISCGAKFGCDYLLYDGPRQERHAFAGLRIIPSQQQHNNSNNNNTNINIKNNKSIFPMNLNPFDIAAYVRCLNTAGKLALLATTVVVNTNDDNDDEIDAVNDHHPKEQEQLLQRQHRKVLIIDLALEKIAITTSRRPKKTMEQRLQNLSKKSKK